MTAVQDGLAGIQARSDAWFARAKAALLGALPCRRGCCRCCVGPFAITGLDARAIRRGLDTLEPAVRDEVRSRARRQADEMAAAFPRLRESASVDDWQDTDLDDLAQRFSDRPCPALEAVDGSCRIYPFRPVTCRMMGIPVESGEMVLGACEVQTAIPIRRVTAALREEESRLAKEEEAALRHLRNRRPKDGDEVMLPYGFLG